MMALHRHKTVLRTKWRKQKKFSNLFKIFPTQVFYYSFLPAGSRTKKRIGIQELYCVNRMNEKKKKKKSSRLCHS